MASDLTAEGIEVRTQVAEIASVQSLDRNLTRVFWLIALIGTLGFLASLAANLLANVERKRRELSIVRLIGFPTLSLVLFPVTQAVLVAMLGALAALALYLPVAVALNGWFAESLQPGESICRPCPPMSSPRSPRPCSAQGRRPPGRAGGPRGSSLPRV